MKIKIVDTVWKFKILSGAKYIELHGPEYEGSAAVTDTSSREVFFREDDIDPVHVRHELFHCYFDSLLLNSSNLDRDQTEEACASLMGKYGEELVKNSRKVTAWLNRRMKKE